MTYTVEDVKRVRSMTGAGLAEIKKALESFDNESKVIAYLRNNSCKTGKI